MIGMGGAGMMSSAGDYHKMLRYIAFDDDFLTEATRELLFPSASNIQFGDARLFPSFFDDEEYAKMGSAPFRAIPTFRTRAGAVNTGRLLAEESVSDILRDTHNVAGLGADTEMGTPNFYFAAASGQGFLGALDSTTVYWVGAYGANWQVNRNADFSFSGYVNRNSGGGRDLYEAISDIMVKYFE